MGKIYGCFRSDKIKKGTPKGNLKKHCIATQEYAENQKEMQEKAYGYSYVEPENVKYNRVLVDCKKSYDEIIKECNQEKFGGRTIRKDGIPMLDTVFYYSPEKTQNLLCYFHRNNAHWKQENAEWWEAYKSMPKEERKEKISEEYRWVSEWAKASEKWAEENLGEVVHCVLHCHEGTPHLDCKTLAIKQKGDKWIWAKREILGNSAHLSKMQTKYAEECGAKFGLERGEVHEKGELRKHAETERHMAAEARRHEEEHLEKVENEVLDTQEILNSKKSEYTSLCEEINEKKIELEKISKPLQEAMEQQQAALKHLFEQIQALKPKEREKEKDLFSWLEKHGKVTGNDLGKVRKDTEYINQQSSRIEAEYLSIDDDDDFELG